MKQICHSGVPWTPAVAKELHHRKPCEVPRPPHNSSTLHSVPTSFNDECVICGSVQLWRTLGCPEDVAALRYPHRSLKHLCCLMSALPRGVYWWLLLIPFPWKKHEAHTCRKLCLWERCLRAGKTCQVVLSPWSSQSHQALCLYLLPSNRVAAVAGQYQHRSSSRKDRGVWRFTQADKNWLAIHTQCSSEKSPSPYSPFLWETFYLTSPCTLHTAESTPICPINKDSNIRTVLPCDQPTTVKMLLRLQPQFDWLQRSN